MSPEQIFADIYSQVLWFKRLSPRQKHTLSAWSKTIQLINSQVIKLLSKIIKGLRTIVLMGIPLLRACLIR